MPTVAPYGSWRSPITSELIVRSGVSVGAPQLDGDDLYWVEGRPLEGGRYVLVRRAAGGRAEDVTPAGFNVRTRVHEYGGGAYLVDRGAVFFANYADQRLYRQRPGEAPAPLTEEGALRYADMELDRARGRLLCVCERHHPEEPGREADNFLAAVDAESGAVTPLHTGRTFYAAPRLSPDGAQLAWMAWDHPDMPWDSAELWVAPVGSDGLLGAPRMVAGGRDDVVFQPAWGPDGALYFAAERTGWWNLYRLREGQVDALHPREAEFGAPLWQLGTGTFAVTGLDRLLCTYTEGGVWRMGQLDAASGELADVPLPYTELRGLAADGRRAAFVGASPSQPATLVLLDFLTMKAEEVRRSSEVAVDPGYLSAPEEVAFPTAGGLTAYGFFYPPANRDFAAPAGELPPLLVMSHGGPTGATGSELSLRIQYWTSRGVAVLDVNYGGSTGYGREYRRRLDGRWGIVDVDDCVNGARSLAERGLVDGARLAIRGGSAGGYTTLAALTFRDVFKAGASYYGIGDLEAMARDTHKFESRYLDGLVAPYPERRDVYVERSPIHHIAMLECPVILFQGLEDKIVPPNQSEMMADALRERGIPVAYLAFEGEQHGFRKAETIRRTLDAEFLFYARVFGYTPADTTEPITIENLPEG